MADSKCSVTADVERAAKVLCDGGLVAFGTETVYGLGANALSEHAVARVFEAKNRPHFDPLIVHVADDKWLAKLVGDVPETARRLADVFWPGPLTMVLPKTDLIPDLVTSGLPSVAIRMPDHEQARELLLRADLPVAAPSANPFGQISPTTAEHVLEHLGDRIDLILDGGPCQVGVESTVLLLSSDPPCILRHGGVTQEQIECVIGRVIDSGEEGSPSCTPVAGSAADGKRMGAPSPGMLPQHYAPMTPLVSADHFAELTVSGECRVGAVALEQSLITSQTPFDLAAIEILSEAGDLRQAAARFFGALRRLDAMKLDLIVAWSFPEEGLGRALNDRLRRAFHD